MKRALLAALVLAGAGPLWAEPALTGANAQIRRNAVVSGGSVSTGGGLTLTSTVGESAVASFSGGATLGQAGIVPVLSQPGTVATITAVTKSTGTLDLAWTAPGRDGLLGDVAAGFYRIDYTTDAAHPFGPAYYQVEFATSVVPGQAQAYRLTGLLPNTTYYSRIYLADERKHVAETSGPSDESTLANAPVAPVFTGVFMTSVTISWNIPAGGAEAYGIFASSDSGFGPNGQLETAQTPDGITVTLTVNNLESFSTYYFRLGSYNWQSQFNYDAILSTRTLPGLPKRPQNVNMIADNMGRTVLLTWTNPIFQDPAGVTVVVSTSPIAFTPSDGAAYAVGTNVGGGAVVKSSVPTPGSSHFEVGLTLNVTTYFNLYSRTNTNLYSVAYSTQIVLDIPPMAPAGLAGVVSADGSSITLTWAAAMSNMDGSLFRNGAPIAWEVDRFEVYRSTGIINPGWVLIGTVPASATSYQANVPVPGAMYYYKVVSRDAFQSAWVDQAMAVDTLGAVYALGEDGVSRLRLGYRSAAMVTAAGNAHGQPLLIRAKDVPAHLGGRVVKSLNFETVTAPFNTTVPAFLSGPDASVVLRYEMVGGQVVPSAVGPAAAAPLVPSVTVSNAHERLMAYFVGTNDDAKMYGRVDAINQTVSLESGALGNYQIRTVFRDNDVNFNLLEKTNKVLTPNGDGLNDIVQFTYENPRAAEVTGKIFDLRGGFVADMRPGTISMGNSLMWDARGNGVVVTQGVYIYQIKAEGKTFSGTVVVIR